MWEITNDYLIGNFGKHEINKKNKYAMFDLDGTLIKTASGSKFPKNKDDWVIMPNVKNVLHKYQIDDTYIIIVTNQLKIKTSQQITDFQSKIENIFNALELDNLIVYVSISNSKYRKPCTGFWDDFLYVIKPKKIFYCGDACGRQNDHADTDYKFAYNIGIEFYTPEHIFSASCNNIGKISYPDLEKIKIGNYDFKKKTTDFIIITGMPASGKSYFCKKYLQDYIIVNRDSLKTKKKCLDILKEALDNKQNIVIDNTNPSKESRADFINIAKKYHRNIRSIHFTTSYDIAKHNNIYRSIYFNKPIVPELVYRIYTKQFCKPSLDEGFDELLEIDFKLENKIPEYYKYYY